VDGIDKHIFGHRKLPPGDGSLTHTASGVYLKVKRTKRRPSFGPLN